MLHRVRDDGTRYEHVRHPVRSAACNDALQTRDLHSSFT